MTADHGTNRYMMNTKRRATPKPAGTGTNAYTPMYTNTQVKDMGSIRSNNLTTYHMLDNGGKTPLIPRKKAGGDCGCNGSKVSTTIGKSLGLLYHGKKK